MQRRFNYSHDFQGRRSLIVWEDSKLSNIFRSLGETLISQIHFQSGETLNPQLEYFGEEKS